MIHRRLPGYQFTESNEEMFQPQVGADALVEGVFVKDHAGRSEAGGGVDDSPKRLDI